MGYFIQADDLEHAGRGEPLLLSFYDELV